MIFLFLSILIFLSFSLSHIAAVRLQIFRLQNLFLILLSSVWLLVFFISTDFLSRHIDAERITFFNVPLIFSSGTLYLLLCLWYIIQCTAVERWSPSMKIFDALMKSPNQRITQQEIRSLFTDYELILSRLNDLLEHGHIRYENQRYCITHRGKLIVRLVLAYRKLLGKDVGG